MKKLYISAIILLVIFSVLFGSISCSGNLEDTADEAVSASQNNDTSQKVKTQPDGKQEDNTSPGDPGKENASTDQDTPAVRDSEEESVAGEDQELKENQVVEVVARTGGYYPQEIKAKAGIPTILVLKSEDSYGCERAFVMPQFKFSTILPQNGDTRLDLGVIEAGIKILGVCSMGMYYFEISFE